MKILYYEQDDTLFIEFSKNKVVRDESLNWNIHIGYTEDGIGEITLENSVLVEKQLPYLPRIGLELSLPAAFEQFTWYGRGPHETYCDRWTSGRS